MVKRLAASTLCPYSRNFLALLFLALGACTATRVIQPGKVALKLVLALAAVALESVDVDGFVIDRSGLHVHFLLCHLTNTRVQRFGGGS